MEPPVAFLPPLPLPVFTTAAGTAILRPGTCPPRRPRSGDPTHPPHVETPPQSSPHRHPVTTTTTTTFVVITTPTHMYIVPPKPSPASDQSRLFPNPHPHPHPRPRLIPFRPHPPGTRRRAPPTPPHGSPADWLAATAQSPRRSSRCLHHSYPSRPFRTTSPAATKPPAATSHHAPLPLPQQHPLNHKNTTNNSNPAVAHQKTSPPHNCSLATLTTPSSHTSVTEHLPCPNTALVLENSPDPPLDTPPDLVTEHPIKQLLEYQQHQIQNLALQVQRQQLALTASPSLPIHQHSAPMSATAVASPPQCPTRHQTPCCPRHASGPTITRHPCQPDSDTSGENHHYHHSPLPNDIADRCRTRTPNDDTCRVVDVDPYNCHEERTNSPAAPAIADKATPQPVGPLFTMSSSDQWLYRPPPPYCPIPTAEQDDPISVLDGRIDYLGPVARVKILSALDMAMAHEMPMLVAQNATVAAIVADLQMDVDTVCAAILRGLLHDLSDIQRNLGEDVATILQLHDEIRRLVDVTNDSVFSEADYSTLRELVLVSAVDHRAISLELASAVVSTRSLDSLPAHHDKRACARRALHLYAPLANQLGIWIIQSELEELAFMHLHPKAFHAIRAELAYRMRESQRILEDMRARLEHALSLSAGVRDSVRSVQIKGRIKGSYSCYRKIVRKGITLSDIYDLLALRIILRARGADDDAQGRACYAVADVVKDWFPVISPRTKDYIAHPKSNGYRSLHLTVAPTEDAPAPLEIQIRTQKMHYMAEFGAAAHWVYKQDSREDSVGPLVFFASNVAHIGAGGEKRPDSAAVSSFLTDAACGEKDFDIDARHGRTEKAAGGKTEDDDIEPRGGQGAAYENHADSTPCVMEQFVAEWSVREKELECFGSTKTHGLLGERELLSICRGGYVSALASAILASRVIVMSCGHLYKLTVGSTLLDLAGKMGMASRGMIGLVNGIPMPLSHRLQMSDNVCWL